MSRTTSTKRTTFHIAGVTLRIADGPDMVNDAIIEDRRGGGYELFIEGRFVDWSPEWDDIVATYQLWTERNEYRPTLWYQNERGMTDMLDSEGNIVEPEPRFGASQRHADGPDNPVRVYIADLAAYNDGKLIGEWVDLPMDEDELRAVIGRLSDNFNQDWAIHDYEAPFRIEEFEDVFALNAAMQKIEDSHVDFDVIACIKDYGGYTDWDEAISASEDADVVDVANENGGIPMRPEEDLGYHIVEEVYGGIEHMSEEQVESYFDYEKFGRDWSMGINSDDEESGDQEYYDSFHSDQEYGEAIVDDFGSVAAVMGEKAGQYFDYEKYGRDVAMDYFLCGTMYIRID